MLLFAIHLALAADPHSYFAGWGFVKLDVSAEGWAPEATGPLAEPVGPALAKCLPSADLVARVDATLTLAPDGHTQDVSVSTGPTAEAAAAGKCVQDVLTAPGRVWPAVTRPTRVTFALSPAASIGAVVGRKGVQVGGGTAKDEDAK